VGNFQQGVQHGHGVLTFSDGDNYEGEFRNDTYNGHGTYRYTNGNYYRGEYVNGKMNGKGYFFCNWSPKLKASYDGYWKDGRKNGKVNLEILS
jgi:1-phosphatidylinositol-4-phosphate 5-kinase